MRTINKALFLDLDGTIIKTKSGKTFPVDKEDWQFNKNILQQIDMYVSAGYYVMIVSNQGGIETGVVKLNDFRQKIRRIVNDIITNTGVPFQNIGYRFAVSNNKEDFYRKPNPGMAYDLAQAYILDLSDCLMVGDASGKIRSKTLVYRDLSSPTEWSHANGNYVTQKELEHLEENFGNTANIVVKDFADSDIKFAKSAGMEYLDIEDFLTLTKII